MPLMRWIWPENGPIPTIDGKKSKKIPQRRKSRLYKVESLHHIPAPMTPLFAAVDWLNISINLLLVIHVIICLLLALLVLMQRPKQEGLGAAFGSGLTDQAFGARTTDVLQKGTVYLGTLFFVVTLVLAILIGKRQSANPSMADTSADATEEITPADAAPVLPADVTPVVMPETDGDKKDEAEAPVETPVETPAKTPAEPEVAGETPAETPAEPATGDNQ
jgi:preprotein translocase subunit SecG